MATTFLTLDGVMESPETWTFPFFDGELGATVGALLNRADALLLGRVTYRGFVADGARPLRGVHTYVVSRTLRSLDWPDSTLLAGDLTEQIGALKHRPGRDIAVSGSATLIRSLLEHDLLDELHLLVHPVLVGRGKRLFTDDTVAKPLKLTMSKTFGTGVIHLRYEPATG